MEGLLKFDAIYVALVFVVPGYVFMFFRNQFVAGHEKPGKEQILNYLTLSGINFVVCGWIIYTAYATNLGLPWKIGSWILVSLVLPAGAGVLSGTSTQNEWVRRVYQRLNLWPIHAVPSAWDYKFSKSPGEWVLVTLKNGTQFAGWWAGRSFASDYSAERDLYIEQIFEITEQGPWKATAKSLLILAGEIQTIEFTPVNWEGHNVEETNRNTNALS